jgi:hypothetical protein
VAFWEAEMLKDAKFRAAKPHEESYIFTDASRLHLLVTSGGGTL